MGHGRVRLAVGLNSNIGHAAYAYYLSVMGRHNEAFVEVKKAQELEPLSLRVNSIVVGTLYRARQYDRAIEECKKTIEMDPSFIRAHRQLGMNYEQKGMYPEAIAEFLTVQELTNGKAGAVAFGHAYAVAGKRSGAISIRDDLESRSTRTYVPPYWMATLYVGLGDKDRAFSWLERAYQERSGGLVWLRVDPRLDPLRQDPRFAALAQRIELAS